jgi:hypothetical protein
MKIRKLLQDALGGALGFVGMIISLARCGKPSVKSTEARGDNESGKVRGNRGEGEEKGKHVAIVRKKTAKKKEPARKTPPAKVTGKAVPAIPAKSAKKGAPAAPAKGIIKIAPVVPAKV